MDDRPSTPRWGTGQSQRLRYSSFLREFRTSVKEERNVGLFWLLPQHVVAKMRGTLVCVRVQADHVVIGRVEVLGRERGSIRASRPARHGCGRRLVRKVWVALGGRWIGLAIDRESAAFL